MTIDRIQDVNGNVVDCALILTDVTELPVPPETGEVAFWARAGKPMVSVKGEADRELATATDYIFDRKAAAATKGETYFGYEREDDDRWLIKLQAIDQDDGSVIETYANIGNNGSHVDLDAAWPNRAILVYEPVGDLVGF